VRIGRNDPCHCGSGRKYKRCCCASDAADESARLAAARTARPRDEDDEPINSDPCTLEWDEQLHLWEFFWTDPYRPGPGEHSRLVWTRLLLEHAELRAELHERHPTIGADWEARHDDVAFFICLDCGAWIDVPPPPFPAELIEAAKLTDQCTVSLHEHRLAISFGHDLDGLHRDIREQSYFTPRIRRQLASASRFSTLTETFAARPPGDVTFLGCLACGAAGWLPRSVRPTEA
jgi:hypothetical protein